MKLNNIISYLIIMLAILILQACTEDFEELNQPPTSVTTLNPNYVFSWVQKESVYPGPGFAYWKSHQLQYGSWVQLWGSHVVGFITASYRSNPEFDDGYWASNYEYLKNLVQIRTDLLADIDEVERTRTKSAMAEILEVFLWDRLTAALGDVPYSQAVQAVEEVITLPVYDPQEEVYNALIEKLDNARSSLTDGDVTYNEADYYYGGDIEAWRKFANSLKLKIGLRMTKANPSLAQQVVSEAMQSPLIDGHEYTAAVPTFTGDNFNNHPQIELKQRAQDQMAYLGETFINILKEKDDPRLTLLAEPTKISKNTFAESGDEQDLVYRGIPHGMTVEQYNALIPDNYSFPSEDFILNESIARPMYVMTWAEVEFMKAEAALRGWGASEAEADNFFRQGIRAAMEIYGEFDSQFTIPEADIQDYLDQQGVLSGSFDEKLEQIITQSWLHRLETPIEAYFDWRRTGYPNIEAGPAQGETGGIIPRRGKYHSSEAALNQDNYQQTLSSQGPDSFTTRVWLDPEN